MVDVSEFDEAYREGRVIKVSTPAGDIGGVLIWSNASEAISFGPLAVYPQYHGKGYAKLLMNELFRVAKEKQVKWVQMRVINLRIELFEFYERMGFEKYGTDEYPHPERLTQPCHFFLYRKALDV